MDLFFIIWHPVLFNQIKRTWVLLRASHDFQVKDSSVSFANLWFVYALLYPFYYPSDSLGVHAPLQHQSQIWMKNIACPPLLYSCVFLFPSLYRKCKLEFESKDPNPPTFYLVGLPFVSLTALNTEILQYGGLTITPHLQTLFFWSKQTYYCQRQMSLNTPRHFSMCVRQKT